MSAEQVETAVRRAARMERAWLVRAKPNEHESRVEFNLSHNVVTLGWGDWVVGAPDEALVDKTMLKSCIDRWYEDNRRPAWKSADKVTAVNGIWRFCNEIEVGDLVVLPSHGLPRDHSWIAIGRVEGDWKRDASLGRGARLFRSVEWLDPRIPKSEVSMGRLDQRRWAVLELDQGEVKEALRSRGLLTDDGGGPNDNLSGDEAGVLSDDGLEVPEGAKTRVEVNRYERDPEARRRCLEYYDYTCQACGLNFEERYGELGRGFMHAHHIVPLSQIADHDNHSVNPQTDLVAVCPNCHAMLHHHPDGPCTVEALRQLMAEVQT